jgi:hypothetical protein
VGDGGGCLQNRGDVAQIVCRLLEGRGGEMAGGRCWVVGCVPEAAKPRSAGANLSLQAALLCPHNVLTPHTRTLSRYHDACIGGAVATHCTPGTAQKNSPAHGGGRARRYPGHLPQLRPPTLSPGCRILLWYCPASCGVHICGLDSVSFATGACICVARKLLRPWQAYHSDAQTGSPAVKRIQWPCAIPRTPERPLHSRSCRIIQIHQESTSIDVATQQYREPM